MSTYPSTLAAPLRAYVLTVSDRCARGEREDLSGPAVRLLLQQHGFSVAGHGVVPDEQPLIEAALLKAAGHAPLLVTTGGTGLAARDVTPEATRAVCFCLLDGLSERMRAEGLVETPFAVLSRGVCGLLDHGKGRSLVVNLPGSPRGASTSLQAVVPVLSHALRLLSDPNTPHPPGLPKPDAARDEPA